MLHVILNNASSPHRNTVNEKCQTMVRNINGTCPNTPSHFGASAVETSALQMFVGMAVPCFEVKMAKMKDARDMTLIRMPKRKLSRTNSGVKMDVERLRAGALTAPVLSPSGTEPRGG